MVLALFALSLAMIVGGIAAVVQGFPYVRLESGLAMVIGGTTAASAGVVLLGLGAAVTQLKRLESLLSSQRTDSSGPRVVHAAREDAPLEVASQGPAAEADLPITTRARPSLAGAGTAGLAGLTLGAVPIEASIDSMRASEAEPVLPNLLPPEEPASAGPDEDLFAHPEDRTRHLAKPAVDATGHGPGTAEVSKNEAQEEFALRPAFDEPTSGEPEPAHGTPHHDAADPEPSKQERQAVGSYASGGNTYVMYSDGTIDADTPRGRFTFQSLDELKDFVATGEAGERGAA